MSVVELIEAGNMDSRVAAMFWIAMEHGASLIIAADPPSSGKTTTLSALLTFTRPDTVVYFTQGQGETFALPRLSDSYDTYILVNEMSDHIPVYTWDDHARRTFALLADGYRLGTTMHADTVQGVLQQLEGDLRIPRSQVAHLTFIVPLYIGRANGIIRRVKEVSMLQPVRSSYKLSSTVEWVQSSDEFRVLEDQTVRDEFGAWAGLAPDELTRELDERAGFLESLRKTGVVEIPAVNTAIEDYYERVLGSAGAGELQR
jgi:hypothetical protein